MGRAARAPRFTVTLLWSSIVEMSKGSLLFWRAAADDADEPATWDCAATDDTELADMVMAAPGAETVEPARRPAVVRVAELMAGGAGEVLTAAWGWPGGGLPPAMTVTACVARVEGGGFMEAMAGMSWKGAAWGADIGNEPAGQLHAQLHWPEPAAAAAA